MDEVIVSVDSSEVLEGRLEELKQGMKDLAAFVEANEERPVAYRVCFDGAGSLMTVVQVHPDSASMELHLEMAGPLFRKVADFLRMVRVDVYGRPSDHLVEQLRGKAALLGGAPVTVHEPHAGFARIAAG